MVRNLLKYFAVFAHQDGKAAIPLRPFERVGRGVAATFKTECDGMFPCVRNKHGF